jgi:hypothetical protein
MTWNVGSQGKLVSLHLTEFTDDSFRPRREQAWLDAEQKRKPAGLDDTREREHLGSPKQMGVDLTAYLTRGRPDRVIELRGSDGSTHLHLQTQTCIHSESSNRPPLARQYGPRPMSQQPENFGCERTQTQRKKFRPPSSVPGT